MDSNSTLLLFALAFLLYYLYTSNETFENQDKSKECSERAIDKAIYGYQVNMINRGAR